MASTSKRSLRIGLAVLLPFMACGVQWQFWQLFKPFVWFLFFPTIFLSSRIGGKFAGIVSTIISAILVLYVFIPPQLSFSVANPNNYYSVLVFLLMGGLFSFTHDKLERATQHAATALEESRLANDLLKDSNRQVTLLYEKTLKLDELKTRFFANVSHELRTPLTLILGPVGRCLSDTGLHHAIRHDLEVVQRNALMLYRQVNDLLDMAKLEAGAMAMHYSKVDLAGLVRFVASHFESLAEENSIRYLIETPDLLESQADQEKCRRILLNLLANAFKFTPSGGEISVTLRMHNSTVCIEVRDSGPGIPEDKRETIFERFSQIDGGVERKFGGTGLGLAIVKEFIQLHGGHVSVSQAPGGGALFTVTLPQYAPQGTVIHSMRDTGDDQFQCLVPVSPPQPGDIRRGAVSDDAPLILVVEDNPDMNRYIASLLAQQYRVASAFDGEEGLVKTTALQPDLLISDMMMPRMSGERMVQELRNQREMDSLPIIMLSAKADDELRVRLLENGIQEYLTKPFSDAELMARVSGLLAARSRTAGELRKSEERLRLALDATSDALWDWDVGSGKVYRSPRYFELVGHRPDEGAPDFEFFVRTVHPDDLPHALQTIDAHKQGTTTSIEFEYRLANRSDETRWMGVRGRAVERDATGAPLRIVGTLSDITERKRTEEEIRLLNITLEQRVEQRTAELLAANRELDSFAYAVSHDLRAPLRAMGGFSQALMEDYGEQLQGEARTYLEQITHASLHMGELIDGLLTLSRCTRGELRHDPLVLSEIAHRIRDELTQLDPARPVTWRIQPEIETRGDSRMLEVVMRNLLGNAWKYTSTTLEAEIRVFADERHGQRLFCVADNGAGFHMDHADMLFQPFKRLHRQDEFPGIGIGLATVQRIIHRHGGEITAEGVPGKGATFRFTLPESAVPFTA